MEVTEQDHPYKGKLECFLDEQDSLCYFCTVYYGKY